MSGSGDTIEPVLDVEDWAMAAAMRLACHTLPASPQFEHLFIKIRGEFAVVAASIIREEYERAGRCTTRVN